MKIAALVSGGVDSSVALALLKEAGHDVTAFYLKIWLEDEFEHLGDCAWEEDIEYVEKTCKKFGVPFQVLSLQREYWDTVVAETITEVKAGRTPNPDIWCNEKIKFGSFYEKIPEEFEKVATGHYAQVEERKLSPFQNEEQKEIKETYRLTSSKKEKTSATHFFLKTAPDPIKDQTYFLSRLHQKQLSRAMFPIGHLEKFEVRNLAEKYDLPSKSRPDSQGICFLGKFKFSDFLRQHLGEKKGEIREKETGRILGEHHGFWFYTFGQRQGLGLSGGPWFVVEKIPEENLVFVSRNIPEDSGKSEFFLENCNFIPFFPKEGEYEMKLRHGEKFCRGTVRRASKKTGIPLERGDEISGNNSKNFSSVELSELKTQNSNLKIFLKSPDRGIAPGQSTVLYADGYCLGGGVVSEFY